MRAIHELTNLIAEFPGVGPRQARRIVQFLLGRDQSYREELASSLSKIRKSVSQCRECYRFADGSGICALCTDRGRDDTALMVVEKDVDVEGVEASEAYAGRYFVLGGLISMARQRKNGNGTRTKELMNRIGKLKPAEVVFALSATPEGDYTAGELMRELKATHPGMKLTLLGRGLSIGAEIEYADRETLRNALKNRG
ncbi:MAG: toprim domain-containing protein [Patescibacteria group bacterium]